MKVQCSGSKLKEGARITWLPLGRGGNIGNLGSLSVSARIEGREVSRGRFTLKEKEGMFFLVGGIIDQKKNIWSGEEIEAVLQKRSDP